MNRNVQWMMAVVAVTAVFVAGDAGAFYDWGGNVCYRVSSSGRSDGNVFRLVVKRQSALTTAREEWRLGHPRQTVYSVYGKVVPRQGLMGTVTGTVVVVKGEGARLGLQRNSVALGETFSVLDCTAPEPSSTPDEWPVCAAMVVQPSAVNVVRGTSLTRVDPLDEPLCSNFNVDVR